MSENSKIEWTNHTFNPWRGCTKVSPGCANCYAETLSKRNPAVLGQWGLGKPRVLGKPGYWRQPIRWNEAASWTYFCSCGAVYRAYRPHMGKLDSYAFLLHGKCYSCGTRIEQMRKPSRPRVFCASLADWLDDEVPIEWLADLLALIYKCRNLDWQLLTKRPENWRSRVCAAGDHLLLTNRVEIYDAFLNPWLHASPKPPVNVWIGTTGENQEMADKRILQMLKIPARVRFLSCEPLLGPIDITDYIDPIDGGYLGRSFIDWIICGGESGRNARPMHSEWAQSLRDQCVDAGVPFFFKQWGEWLPVSQWEGDQFCGTTITLRHDGAIFADYEPHGFCCSNCSSEDVLRVGKKAAGRLLDGREHNEFPEVSRE